MPNNSAVSLEGRESPSANAIIMRRQPRCSYAAGNSRRRERARSDRRVPETRRPAAPEREQRRQPYKLTSSESAFPERHATRTAEIGASELASTTLAKHDDEPANKAGDCAVFIAARPDFVPRPSPRPASSRRRKSRAAKLRHKDQSGNDHQDGINRAIVTSTSRGREGREARDDRTIAVSRML